jgi:hypothetical protein
MVMPSQTYLERAIAYLGRYGHQQRGDVLAMRVTELDAAMDAVEYWLEQEAEARKGG